VEDIMTEPAGTGTDEFASLTEVADELGLDRGVIPEVTRRSVEVPGGQRISVLTWGSGEPELVFLHGGGQNAHTWDLVALGLGRPAIALDLPGHGHSSWRADQDYGPVRNAEAVAPVIEQLAPRAAGVIGMSLGGLTSIRLASTRPDLVRRLVIVDVTPGSGAAARHMTREQAGAIALVGGPPAYASREEMVAAAVQASPRRPPAAVRRGVIHNSRQLPDGTFAWRYDRHQAPAEAAGGRRPGLWDDLGRLRMPVMLVKGSESVLVTPEDLAEVRSRLPQARTAEVAGSGHAVQSDQPAALIALIADFIPA
jgi:pimeloyl-ACP methyl ester carboxylesterase